MSSASWTGGPGPCRRRSIPGRWRSAPRGWRTRGGIDEGTVAYLRECGIEQAGYRDAIEVRSPNPIETRFFDLPADGRIQVIEIFRDAFDQHHKRVRLTVTVYRADRNRFIY